MQGGFFCMRIQAQQKLVSKNKSKIALVAYIFYIRYPNKLNLFHKNFLWANPQETKDSKMINLAVVGIALFIAFKEE